jgi:SAM-dependent methyltransferase
MGNGHLLFELLENQDEGFPAGIGALVGIDYSPASVRLSAKIAHERGVQERVKFDVVDVLENTWTGIPGGFDIVVDKGTFDAICLSAELRADGRRPEECYPECVARLMKSGALLVVTSCNWTEEELVKKITACCGEFSFFHSFCGGVFAINVSILICWW